MRSMKLLQSACMLAVAFGVMTTVEAVAQTRDKPASSQARQATQAQSNAHPKRKPAKAKHARKKSRPVAASKPAPRKAVATTRPSPPPVAWVPPPLGPERFYPNGIPPLRPEFMHPEAPPARVEQASRSRTDPVGGQPAEWLP